MRLSVSARTRRIASTACAAVAVAAAILMPGQLQRHDTSVQTRLTPVPHATTAPAATPSTSSRPLPAIRTTVDRPKRHRTPVTIKPRSRTAAARPAATTAAVRPAAPSTTPVTRSTPAPPPSHTSTPPAQPVQKPVRQPKSQSGVAAVQATTQSQYAFAILDMLNGERADHGLAPLTMNTRLIVSAHGHNLAMARANTMSHQLPGEPYFADRIEAAGYDYDWAGENVGWNSDTSLDGVKALETMMYNEKPPNDGHRQNILSPHFTNVGIDVYFDKVNHKVWLTQDFGSPA
jgi:uncharacterized protein YkwD